MNNSYTRLSVYLWVAAFVFVYSSHTYSQVAQADKSLVVDLLMRKRLVDNIIRELKAKYVAPEKNKEIESYVRTKLQSRAAKLK